jgi:sucrose phosphorylase
VTAPRQRRSAPSIAPRPQLLTYPDSLGGDLPALIQLLDGAVDGAFSGIHLLPPFPSSGDRGFAPVTYGQIDPRFGSWQDIATLAARHDVLLDLMINHLSRRSPEFRDFERYGRAAASANLFITLDKIWPDGIPRAADVARIFLRKPQAPFSTVVIEATGATETVWTTFGTADWSEQIDLDVNAPETRQLIRRWLEGLAERRVAMVRLDAVGYVIKEPGTDCFMVEPGIWEFLEWTSDVAASLGLTILPEVHDTYATHERLSSRGYWTYDFVLPGLVLHAFATGRSERLARHLDRSPDRQVTTLDSHDGIPVRPDLDGILEPDEMRDLAGRIRANGGNVNRILSSKAPQEVDVHQLNCTYYSAMGCDDERYLAARAIQLFAKGVPQVYYVGLLAGENDVAALERTGEGRAVNRHDYTIDEIEAALERPVVRRLLELVRLRNTHPAFDGTLEVSDDGGSGLSMRWRHGEAACCLTVDLATGRGTIEDGDRSEPIAG